MTKLQNLTIEQSTLREALQGLLAKDDLSDDERRDLDVKTKRLQALEPELRAATVLEQDAEARRRADWDNGGDSESAEVRQLLGRARAGEYMQAAAGGRAVSGVGAELNAALNVQESGQGVSMPLDVLWVQDGEARAQNDGAEHRQATDSSSYGGGMNQRPILQRLFGPGVFDALGVRIDSVPPGQAQWPLLVDGSDPQQLSEGASATVQEARFATRTLLPKRISGAYLWSVEAGALVSGLEAALRRDLGMAIKAAMQDQAINGSGVAPEVDGFLNRLPAGDVVESSTAPYTASYTDLASAHSAAVDGVHAMNERQIGSVIGVDLYRYSAGILQAGSGESASEALMRRSRSCVASTYLGSATTGPTVTFTGGGGGSGARAIARVRGGAVVDVHIVDGGTGYTSDPTVAITGAGGSGATATATATSGAVTAVQVSAGGSSYTSGGVSEAIFHAGSGAGRSDSVAAMWPTLELIRDVYSGAAEGRVTMVWVALWDMFAACRAQAYLRRRFRVGLNT